MAATSSSNNSNSNNNIETDEFIKKSRVTRAAPPKPAYDPLQFVQIKPAKLYDLNKAKPSTERKVVEVKTPREVVEDTEEWQCNLDSWKSSRRKRVEHIIDKITEAKKIEQEEVCRGRKKSKTFSEMLENSGSRRRFILPENEDEDEGGSFSEDIHDPCDGSKPSVYKDESTDDRVTDDTSSCCSSKLTDGETKTPDLDDTREAAEMNEFSLAIENYKSKFPMTQCKLSTKLESDNGSSSIVATNTCSSVVSSIESNGNDNYESISTCEAAAAPEVARHSAMEYMIQTLSCLEVEREEKRCLVTVEPMESRSKIEHADKKPHGLENQEERPKVNVIERRRLFEQFQQITCSADTTTMFPTVIKSFDSTSTSVAGTGGHQQQQERCTELTTSSNDEATSIASSVWLAAGSIKERRAIFERYQSNEMIAEEHDQRQQHMGGGRTRSISTTVVKSRSESNVGFINGSTGRFELALNQLKRNGTDCCEDSGIHSTTDLSRSSVVSQADEHDPSMLVLLSDEVKSPVRSTTLDSASEFSDTDCSNGQLLDNALDVAFEEMDNQLNESGTTEQQQTHPEFERPPVQQVTEIVPLSVATLPSNEAVSDDQLVLMSLPKPSLTPPKEKPPPPPVDEEPEIDLQTQLSPTIATITNWMQINHSNRNGNNHGDLIIANEASDVFEQMLEDELRPGMLHHLPDEQWRSLECYEVVQQVQHQTRQKQHEQEKEPELDKDQQEVMVYSNQIETVPPHHHQDHHHPQLYDPGEHENVNSYASYDTPFLDEVNSYYMGSLHRESMPNLSNAAASSSHASSLSSYGEEYSINSATSFDGGCWPPPVDHRQGAGRPVVAPRPALNGFPDRTTMNQGTGVGYHATGSGQRLSSNMFEQYPKDNKQNAHHPTSRVQGGQGGTNNMPYGQHWLVQEAEQRRIEQHQKSTADSTKRPLPKFVIDAITQRVQKLNAGSPENSDRSVLSEDSDLAMINSIKHHHLHQSQSVPSHHHHHKQQQQHHHHQQPLPQPQQQKYSNANDKVLSVSGKKECSHCRIELGKGAAMAIESLGLFYHIECFKCCVCHVKLGDGTNGIDVRVRKYRLHCQNCFSSEDGVKFSCVMLLTIMYFAMTIRTSIRFRAIRNCLDKILTDRYAISFYTTSNGVLCSVDRLSSAVNQDHREYANAFPTFLLTCFVGDSTHEVNSPDGASFANVSSCIWYHPDQRGCLVYPVRRKSLAHWICFPELLLDSEYTKCPTINICNGTVQLIVTLECSDVAKHHLVTEFENSVMLSRFGRFLAWNRIDQRLEVLLETDTIRLFQLIVATFGSGRFHVDSGRLKLVRVESVQTSDEPMSLEESNVYFTNNILMEVDEEKLRSDAWLSVLMEMEKVKNLESSSVNHFGVGMQPDIISSNDIKISSEMLDGTVFSGQNRSDILSSGSNSRNRSQLDLTDGIVSANDHEQTRPLEEPEHGPASRSITEKMMIETELDACIKGLVVEEEMQFPASSPKETAKTKGTPIYTIPPPQVLESTSNGIMNHHDESRHAKATPSVPPSPVTPPTKERPTTGVTQKSKGARSLRKSSFPSSRLRLGTDPGATVTKPPNILVHSDSGSTMEYVIATLNNLLELNTYTIYPITTGQVMASTWQQSTVLIIVAGSLDTDVRKILLDFFLHGGLVFSLCSDMLDIILPDSKTAEIRERELVSFSYRKWKQIKMLHHIFCYQLSPSKNQFSLESEETATLLPVSYVDVSDRKGIPHSLVVEILAQEETWNTPSILEAHNRKTGGRAIFSQIHLELDPSQFQSNIDASDNSLQNSNQLRYEILSDLLGSRIGLKMRDKNANRDDVTIAYRNAYFLGKHEAKVEMLDALKSTMIRPNIIQTHELTLQFCGKSDNAPSPATDSHLPVMIFHCPEDFSTVEYFENLTTNKIGRIGIYAPIMASSMLIVSHLTLAHGFMVIARHQTKGKGRSNNQWLSPPGCAMFSLQLHVPMNSVLGQRLPIVQHLVAIAVVSAVLSLPGYEVSV
uniref:LIM zinc-binding domain-containing protein n=1 Tax=Anopheles dirus TaxID=7168 RepID=A0A182N9Z3_9DIPT